MQRIDGVFLPAGEINPAAIKRMEDEIGCRFCDGGEFAEMMIELADYKELTAPIPGVEYRFCRPDEAESIKSAVAAVEGDWLRYFDDPCAVFAAFSGGELASFCIVEPSCDGILSVGGAKVGTIGCVGTLPQFRRRGIGLRLVDAATCRLKEMGFLQGYISYTAIDKWYARLGYRVFARFDIP